jgi:hypothetical protein
MRSEVRTLEGKVVASFWPDDVDEVTWDADTLHVLVTLHDAKGDRITSGPDGRLDRISRKNGALLGSKTVEKHLHAEEADAAVTIVSHAGGEQKLPRAPWSFGYWSQERSLGVELRSKGKNLFLRGKEGPWVALTLAKTPDAIDLAPPWLALHGAAGIVTIRIDELLTAPAIHLDGETIVTRAKKVERPRPSKKLTDWFDLLVAQGLLAPLGEVERDQLIFSLLEDATKPAGDSLGRILEGRSPLVVSHDSHWFEDDDHVIERFDAALEGAPVRFTEDDLDEGSVTIGVTTPSGKSTFSCESFVYEVAEALDAHLKANRSKKRIYTLDSYQEDIHLYMVLTPAHRKRLVAAGIEGIGKDATPHDS